MKKQSFMEKLVKKDYNNELEKKLEQKTFEENVQSNLLSILYKIETAYKDYETVKRDVETKEEYIEQLIKIIEEKRWIWKYRILFYTFLFTAFSAGVQRLPMPQSRNGNS